MKKLSIFSLIRLGVDENAKDELLRRFNNYKDTKYVGLYNIIQPLITDFYNSFMSKFQKLDF